MPIRLGDGTEISPSGIQEVRLGDGTVLWSSGPDYGADIIHQWAMSEGSGTSLADRYGDADATINGAAWDSSSHEWYDEYALSGDGSSDYVDTGPNDNTSSQIAVALTVAHPYSGSDAGGVENLATSGFDGDTPWEVRFNGTDLEFSVWDGGTSTHYLLTEPISTLSPNHPHRIVAQYGDGDMELWVNGTLVDSTSAPATSFAGSSQRLLFAHDDAGTISGHFGGLLDNVIIFDGPLSDAGIQIDLDNQPWPVDDTGGPEPVGGDQFNSQGEPIPNSDGPFGIYDGDIPAENWVLEAADDFTGTLDDSNWHASYGWGRTHSNAVEYTRNSDTWVDQDTNRLVIRTDYDTNAPNNWYSGAANTLRNVDDPAPSASNAPVSGTHGVWEASIRMPEPVDGFVPGFWCRGAEQGGNSAWPPEVDFVERFGWSGGTTASGNVHWADSSGNHEYPIHDSPVGTLSDNFHVFSCHWTPSYCSFYVDGILLNDGGRTQTTSAAHGYTGQLLESQLHYAIFTQHVWPADWNGDPPDPSAAPFNTEMDWFRYWTID